MKQNKIIKIVEDNLGNWPLDSTEAMDKITDLIEKYQKEYNEARVINIQRGKESFNDHRRYDYIVFIELVKYIKKEI
jgi:hypothetical protein